VAQDLDAVMAFAPDPDPLATSGVARIDDDPSARTAFARQVRNSRRIAKWSGAVLALLALLLIGVFEFGQQGQFGRVLDDLAISRGTAVGDSAAVSASAEAPAGPVTPPIAADAGATGAATPRPTEPTAADSPAGVTAPASPAGAPIAADAGAATPIPTEPTAAESPAGATAPDSPASPDRATPAAAATAAPPEPAAVAEPPALTPPPTRVAQQHAPRAPTSPREVCGPRTQFSLYRCMQMQCSQRRWASHAQCERLRTTDSVD
jgi:hypothetical protein